MKPAAMTRSEKREDIIEQVAERERAAKWTSVRVGSGASVRALIFQTTACDGNAQTPAQTSGKREEGRKTPGETRYNVCVRQQRNERVERRAHRGESGTLLCGVASGPLATLIFRTPP